MTEAAEQLYLATLSASANIRLSAAATGFAHTSFCARRDRHAAFAREERLDDWEKRKRSRGQACRPRPWRRLKQRAAAPHRGLFTCRRFRASLRQCPG
jgi:hypothetical protein